MDVYKDCEDDSTLFYIELETRGRIGDAFVGSLTFCGGLTFVVEMYLCLFQRKLTLKQWDGASLRL